MKVDGRVCCYTSFTYAYLGRAHVLADTVRAAHADWTIGAVIVDRPPPGADLTLLHAPFDFVVGAAELGPDDFLPWLFRHDVVEACTAVKGAMLRKLLVSGARKVIYLDPDIAVFHGLGEILSALEAYSIVLTPHQLAPNADAVAMRDNELAALRYGLFNLGFLAVRNDEAARAFAEWWHARLLEACYDDPASGVFTDQKYCDLVPCLFDGVLIHRDPGCNVASWNLSRRQVTIDDEGAIRVNGSLLKFYHFTKIGSAGDVMTERYGADNVEVFEIWSWYRRTLASRTPAGIPRDYWAFGTYADGEPIPRGERLAFRALPEAASRFPNPFAVGDGSYRNLVREAARA